MSLDSPTASPLRNMLLEPVEYKITETSQGVWRRFLWSSGELFEEYRTHAAIGGWPLIHYTKGRCPETGARITAFGVLAIGRKAVGLVAIGQAALGFVAIGQLSVGLALALGQAAFAVNTVGQLAVGVAASAGQFATGYVAVGQIGCGSYVLAQKGFGNHVLDSSRADPEAKRFFLGE